LSLLRNLFVEIGGKKNLGQLRVNTTYMTGTSGRNVIALNGGTNGQKSLLV